MRLLSSVVGVSWNLWDVIVLWRFNARFDGNLDVVTLLRRRSEGGMNIFGTEDASVSKETVARGGQVFMLLITWLFLYPLDYSCIWISEK